MHVEEQNECVLLRYNDQKGGRKRNAGQREGIHKRHFTKDKSHDILQKEDLSSSSVESGFRNFLMWQRFVRERIAKDRKSWTSSGIKRRDRLSNKKLTFDHKTYNAEKYLIYTKIYTGTGEGFSYRGEVDKDLAKEIRVETVSHGKFPAEILLFRSFL
jgi:hypothetical protein